MITSSKWLTDLHNMNFLFGKIQKLQKFLVTKFGSCGTLLNLLFLTMQIKCTKSDFLCIKVQESLILSPEAMLVLVIGPSIREFLRVKRGVGFRETVWRESWAFLSRRNSRLCNSVYTLAKSLMDFLNVERTVELVAFPPTSFNMQTSRCWWSLPGEKGSDQPNVESSL